ncbi:helix-turn-helix domain-containing protein [Nonomuraea sp. NPDC052116]|uniref:helix-turn-helix domain-containing protein n=1 Tax=Nonomuraea sp. NPDC052116 TaxID=3155665 RepID=UPI003414BD52
MTRPDEARGGGRWCRARGQSVTQIARKVGVGRSTPYRALEDDDQPATSAAEPAK